MIKKDELTSILIKALRGLSGKATIVQICKWIWENYQSELEESGELFYTWQYDIRWAATKLRKKGVMKSENESPRGIWILNRI